MLDFSLLDPQQRIWLPVDVSTAEEAKQLAGPLASFMPCVKVGQRFTHAIGTPQAVALMRELGFKYVWVDAKLGDIPYTVGGAADEIVKHGVEMFNFHASMGIDPMIDAVSVKRGALAIAVTVLTSLTEPECFLLYGASIQAKVLQFARDAKLADCDGVVCSPGELKLLTERRELKGMKFFTPNVRPAWYVTADDQNKERGMTPAEAIKAGATALVIGRPITKPPKEVGTPADAFKKICDEIAAAL